jgi:hypothetical protein
MSPINNEPKLLSREGTAIGVAMDDTESRSGKLTAAREKERVLSLRALIESDVPRAANTVPEFAHSRLVQTSGQTALVVLRLVALKHVAWFSHGIIYGDI